MFRKSLTCDIFSDMNAFNKIFTATEEFLVTVPIRKISRHIVNLTSCSGSSVRHIFGNFNFVYQSHSILDQDASDALRKMMDAMSMWAECIRVHPEDLRNDEPYNIIIFQPPVRCSTKYVKYF